MLDDINSNMKLLAEGHKDLKEGQTGIIARLDRVEVKVSRVEMKTDVMYKELSGQRTDVIEIKDRLTKLEVTISRA